MVLRLLNLWSGSKNSESRVSLKTVFSIDLRSMALMRVSLAVLILVDLILRAANITQFYSDDGVLPRNHWLEINNAWYFSLHAASGALWWQVTLFLLAGTFAIGLLIGFRTRLMTILSWILLISLCNRNPMLLQGGDLLLMVMCFWAMFLPLGAKCSVDAALQPELLRQPNQTRFKPNKEQLYFSMATIAVIFQVLFLYTFTALLKTGDAWQYPFEAGAYTLQIQHYATPLGLWFQQMPLLSAVGAAYVLAVEYIAPVLVLIPLFWPIMRSVGLLLLASLHIAFLTLLHIGLFPLIDFMSLTLLIPSVLWISLAKRRERLKPAPLTLYYDQDCGFCLKMCLILREWLLPETAKILTAQSSTTIYPILQREDSWVVQDVSGRTYLRWEALAFLFTQCWLTKPLGWIMRFPPCLWLGNMLYRQIAVHRSRISTVTARYLVARPLKLRPTIIGQCLALFFLAIVFIYNVSTLPGMSDIKKSGVDTLSRMFRIDQKWNMFAPAPITTSVFPQVEGKLRNGESVNLYPLTDVDPDWIAPTYMYPLYDGYRSRKYFDRLRTQANHSPRSAYGHYHCKKWNSKAQDRQQQLGFLTLHFVSLETNLNGEPKERRRKLAWRHWCYPEFKPKS